MKNLRWLVLGYFMAFCTQGCDLGITNSEEGFDVQSSGLGEYPWNPVYVKIVD